MATASEQKVSSQEKNIEEYEEAVSELQRLRNQGETNPNRPAGGKIQEVKWDS